LSQYFSGKDHFRRLFVEFLIVIVLRTVRGLGSSSLGRGFGRRFERGFRRRFWRGFGWRNRCFSS
jgi:hypothetical protein